MQSRKLVSIKPKEHCSSLLGQYIFKIVNHDTEMGLVVPESSMKYALQAWKKRRYYSVVIKPDHKQLFQDQQQSSNIELSW